MKHQVSRFGSYGVIICDGKILLTQKERGPYQGLWGAIEFEETPEEALKREILGSPKHVMLSSNCSDR